jgi:hypothetical protein
VFQDFFKYFGFIIFSMLLACSKNDPDLSLPSTQLIGSLESGLWNTSCFSNGISSLKLAVTFANGSYNSIASGFSDTTCSTSSSQVVETGTYIASAMSSNGGGTLDWTLVDMVATPLTSTQASSWNSSSFCGWTDWAANISKSLLGRTCGSSSIPLAGITVYDIYKIEQNDFMGLIPGTLEFGSTDAQHDGLTTATRPTVYNGNYIYSH